MVYAFKKLVYNISIYSQEHWYTNNTLLAINSIYKKGSGIDDKKLSEKQLLINNSSYVYFSQLLLANTGESAFRAKKNNITMEVDFAEIGTLNDEIYVIMGGVVEKIQLGSNRKAEVILKNDIESLGIMNIELIFFLSSAVTFNSTKVEYSVKVISEFSKDKYKKSSADSVKPFEFPFHDQIFYKNLIVNVTENEFSLLADDKAPIPADEDDNIIEKLSFFVTVIMAIVIVVIICLVVYYTVKKWRNSGLARISEESELKSQSSMKKVEIV